MLNLSNLAAYLPNVAVDFNDRSFVFVLFDLMSRRCADILTVLFNQNKIKTLAGFGRIKTSYGLKIINLSLDSNEISDFDELSALKDLNLRELVLSNNPVSAGLDEVTYKLEVVRRLPDLGFLDTRKIKAGADTHPVTQLPPLQGNFFDAPARQALADAFLQKYYEAYDGDRNTLVDAYAEQSCFSISTIPVDSKPHGRGGSSFKRGDKFVPYNSVDRNMTTTLELDDRTTRLKTGPTHIVGTLLDLPPTKHEYESFTVDCFVTSLGSFEMLNVFVHGSFSESSKTKRSFSRVFLLVPSPAGSKAQANGWPGVIINDQFFIRHFTPKRVKAPPPQVPPPQVAPPTAATTAQPLTQADQQKMVIRLSEITTMNLAFSEQCLVQNNWNYELALQNFQDLKNRNVIPPEAYVK
jgi:nuclear RNA export factor